MQLALFASLSHVYLAKRRLAARGMPLEMTRVPHCLAAQGCAFALRCPASELETVKEVAEQAGIPWRGAVEEPSGFSLRTASLFEETIDES